MKIQTILEYGHPSFKGYYAGLFNSRHRKLFAHYVCMVIKYHKHVKDGPDWIKKQIADFAGLLMALDNQKVSADKISQDILSGEADQTGHVPDLKQYGKYERKPIEMRHYWHVATIIKQTFDRYMDDGQTINPKLEFFACVFCNVMEQAGSGNLRTDKWFSQIGVSNDMVKLYEFSFKQSL